MAGGKRIVEAAMDSFGRLDILVNNAGILNPSPIWEMNEQDWDVMMAVHLKGHFTTIRHAAPIFREQGSGVIINTASESGLGHFGMPSYSAAKEGIIGFTRSIACDLGRHNVRCNAIRPRGATRMALPEAAETVRISQDELGYPALGNSWISGSEPYLPSQVAAFVTWLCSDAASNVNGRDFFVGGGAIGLFSEPELVRSAYRAGGWTLDAMNDETFRGYLVGDLKNRFCGRTAQSVRPP